MKMLHKARFKLPEHFTKEQQKIVYVVLMVVLFFVCFLVLIHGPQSRKLAVIKKDLSNTEAQIADISKLASGGNLAEAVKALKIKLDALSAQLPSEDEIVIRSVLEGARKLRIDVSNVSPGAIKPMEAQAKDYVISEFPISMHLSCDYRTLGEYLGMLIRNFPVLVKLRKVDIAGNGEGQVNLNIDLQISAYLAVRKK